MELPAEIRDFYDQGLERDRLAGPSLEKLRTQVLLARHLPEPPARILDVGGGGGVYATWLVAGGHEVHLVDPVPLHVEQARAAGLSADLGDARQLAQDDASYDAVLLLGPLYHLVERADRVRALSEAARVTRPDGLVAAAAISRYASLLDGYYRAYVDRPGFVPLLEETLRSGNHRNPDAVPRHFTTAYFHRPEELAGELGAAGLRVDAVLPIEGPFHWAPGMAERLADAGERDQLLDLLARIEDDPALTAASPHLLAVGRPPS